MIIDKIKPLGVLVASIGLFAFGYWSAANFYKAKIATMKENAEREVRQYAETDKARILEQRDTYARATSVLLEQFKESENRRRALAIDVDRVRKQLTDGSARLPVSSDSSRRLAEKRLGECKSFLAESLGLNLEGADLVESGAISKDGLSAYHHPAK